MKVLRFSNDNNKYQTKLSLYKLKKKLQKHPLEILYWVVISACVFAVEVATWQYILSICDKLSMDKTWNSLKKESE